MSADPLPTDRFLRNTTSGTRRLDLGTILHINACRLPASRAMQRPSPLYPTWQMHKSLTRVHRRSATSLSLCGSQTWLSIGCRGGRDFSWWSCPQMQRIISRWTFLSSYMHTLSLVIGDFSSAYGTPSGGIEKTPAINQVPSFELHPSLYPLQSADIDILPRTRG